MVRCAAGRASLTAMLIRRASHTHCMWMERLAHSRLLAPARQGPHHCDRSRGRICSHATTIASFITAHGLLDQVRGASRLWYLSSGSLRAHNGFTFVEVLMGGSVREAEWGFLRHLRLGGEHRQDTSEQGGIAPGSAFAAGAPAFARSAPLAGAAVPVRSASPAGRAPARHASAELRFRCTFGEPGRAR